MAEPFLAAPEASRPSPLDPLGVAASVPPITSEVPGSFAWGVLHERHPKLIQQIAQAHPYPPEQRRALDALLAEIAEGQIISLPESADDRWAWDAWAGDYLGQPWEAVPFLWAESYFYRKLLEAVGFFTPGPWFWVDPFEHTKAAEVRGAQFGSDLAALDEQGRALARRSSPGSSARCRLGKPGRLRFPTQRRTHRRQQSGETASDP